MPNDSASDRYYSDIHTKLVANENDLIGLCAYGIYKQEKLAYIARFKKEHDGRTPSNEDLKHYTQTVEPRLEQYRTLARSNLTDMFAAMYKEQSENLELDYQQKIAEAVGKIQQHSWWYGLFQGVAASFIFTLFLCFLTVALLYSQYGIGWLIKDIATKLSL